MDILLAFYMDASSRGEWKPQVFQRIFQRTSVQECERMDDSDLYLCLNQCVTSHIASSLRRWYLLLDLEDINESLISDHQRECLKYEILSENDHLHPDFLEA